MRKVVLELTAIHDIYFFGKNDVKLLKKISELIHAISKDAFVGIGKPEALKDNLKGYWSRRINDEHRLVYKITEDAIIIISCRTHYQ